MEKSKRELYHLHVLVYKDDVDVIDTLCTSHGDRSLILRGVVKKFADDIRKNIVVDTDKFKEVEDD